MLRNLTFAAAAFAAAFTVALIPTTALSQVPSHTTTWGTALPAAMAGGNGVFAVPAWSYSTLARSGPGILPAFYYNLNTDYERVEMDRAGRFLYQMYHSSGQESVQELDLLTGGRRLVATVSSDHSNIPAYDIDDGALVWVQRTVVDGNLSIWRTDLITEGKTIVTTSHDSVMNVQAPHAVAVRGDWIYFLYRHDPGHPGSNQVWRYSIIGGGTERITFQQYQGIQGIRLSPSGRFLAYEAQEGVRVLDTVRANAEVFEYRVPQSGPYGSYCWNDEETLVYNTFDPTNPGATNLRTPCKALRFRP